MKRLIILLLALSMTFALTSCGKPGKGNDLSASGPGKQSGQDSAAGDRLKIVFEYQGGHVSEEFEEVLESVFDVDIIMSKNNAEGVHYRLEQELTHNIVIDLVVCEYLPLVDEKILTEYFYDMGAEGFVDNYYLSTVESCTASDGGLYFLPGPSYVYGIVYDRTAFRELNLSIPTGYSEFVELIRTVEGMGLTGMEPDPTDNTKMVEVPVRAFVPSMKWADMFQIVFNTMNYESSLRGVTNTLWLNNYQNGDSSMVGHMEAAAEKYLRLFDDGILSLDYWNVKAPYRSLKLYNYHTSLMTIECQHGYEYNQLSNVETPENFHEMGMMPIFTGDEPGSDYLYAIPRSFLGITRQGIEDETKREVLLQIVEYLSTPQGQKLLISGEDYFGFLKNDNSLESDFYSDVIDTIEAGRIISNFYYEGDGNGNRVEAYLHENTPELVKGNITVKEWLEGADAVRDAAIAEKEEEVYGTVTKTLLPIQTAYLVGEAYLNSMDADIAYVPVAADFGTQVYFFSGDITDKKINDATTQTSYVPQPVEGELDFVVVEMTGQELLNLALSGTGNKSAAFAGVEMVFSLSGTDGGQYVSLKIDGKDMDRNATYRVATLRGAASKATVVAEYDGLKFYDIFKKYIVEVLGGTVEAPKRLRVID